MKNTMIQPVVNPARQKGAALLVSLVILLVLTVLALSSMQGSSLQEKMVSSQRDAQTALDRAEAALDFAERELRGGTLPTFNKTLGLYEEDDDVPTDLLNPGVWAGTAGKPVTRKAKLKPGETDKRLDDLDENDLPRYFIKATDRTGAASSNGFGIGAGGVGYGVQQSGFSGKVYRVVAFSSGASGQAARAVEAYILRTQ